MPYLSWDFSYLIQRYAMGSPTITMADAIMIIRRIGFMPSPVSATASWIDETEEEAEAAGFRTAHVASHWETGVPFNDPASHSSPSSKRPLPHAGPADDDEADASEEEILERLEEEMLERAEEENISLLISDEDSELLKDAREKNRMEEAWVDEERLKLQSGKMKGALERTDDATLEVGSDTAPEE